MAHTAPTPPRMRSWLFAPGDSEKKMGKAIASPADIALLDLEEMDEKALEAFRARYEALAGAARVMLAHGETDTDTPDA